MRADVRLDRNGSECSVPNDSEIGKPGQSDPKGRPPVMDDVQLMTMTTSLSGRLGRPPTREALIEAAGGCQRQRANWTLKLLREQVAATAVRSRIELPAELESELRCWLERCLTVCAQQLAVEQARIDERHEQERTADRDLVNELQTSLRDLREALADQTLVATEVIAANRKLEEQVMRLKAERDIANALSEDWMAIIQACRMNA
ncbi:MAG: hypothetical protein QE272_12250 [Nevskia sp.]|nr:hypothetical protein [Nevskia sp.]